MLWCCEYSAIVYRKYCGESLTIRSSRSGKRIALEACKQCGQNWLPKVKPILQFNDWVASREKSQLEIVAALDPRSAAIKVVLERQKRGFISDIISRP